MAGHLQSAGQTFNNVTNYTYAVPVNPTTGSFIAVGVAKYRSGDTNIYQASDLTKSAGTATISTPTLLERNIGGNVVFGFWTFLVTAGGSMTLQVAHAGSGCFGSLFLAEFSGNWVDQTDTSYASTTGNSTTPDSGNITAVRMGDGLFVGQVVGLHTIDVTITEDGAWSLIGEDGTASTRVTHSMIYRIVPKGTVDSASWTFGSADNWGAVAMGFSEGGSFPARMIV